MARHLCDKMQAMSLADKHRQARHGIHGCRLVLLVREVANDCCCCCPENHRPHPCLGPIAFTQLTASLDGW